MKKLREKYRQFEQKRQLCDSYDLFMADERVLPMLPGLLGKTFFDKKKYADPRGYEHYLISRAVGGIIGDEVTHEM